MGWTLITTPVVGAIATVAAFGKLVKDNLDYLKGLAGAVIIEDDLTVDNLITAGLVDGRDVSADGTLLDTHAARHEPTGADEINDIDINNTGVLLTAHAARHENAGADEINVADLSGLLADDQHVLNAEVLAVAAPLAHDRNNHIDRTRYLFAIAGQGTGLRDTVNFTFEAIKLAAGEYCHGRFLLPADFVSLTSVKIGLIGSTTGTFDWTARSEELVNGLTVNTDVDTDTANGQAITDDELLEFNITTAFNGLTLSASRWVGWQFAIDTLTTTIHIHAIGLKIAYTSDE